MNIEVGLEDEAPAMLLRRWNRRIYVCKQRMKAVVVVGTVAGAIGIAGFFVPWFPSWLQVFCFFFVPLQAVVFQKERRILLACRRDVLELEKPMERRDNNEE